jgi:hypothetical protein
MRWLVPVFLVALLAASFALREQHWWYRFALVGQAGFYAVGLAALMVPRLREAALPRIVFYFCQVNAAIVHAAIRVAMRKHMLAWQPSQR